MNPDSMKYFGLTKMFKNADHYEDQSSKELYNKIKFFAKSGGIFAISGMVGSGKTRLLNKLQKEFEAENKITVSRSLSIEKRKLNVNTICFALFYDLTRKIKNFKIPTAGEKRERELIEIIKKQKKPVVLLIDDAHDIHGHTLTKFKRLIESMEQEGCQLSILLAGHPKLANSLRRGNLEEIGARTEISSMDLLFKDKLHYIDWLFKQCLSEDIKVEDVIDAEAKAFCAKVLITPLQVEYYLGQAIDQAYLIGQKPITIDIIKQVLLPDMNSTEARLAREGYQFDAICDLLGASKKETRDFLSVRSSATKQQEFNNIINNLVIHKQVELG